MDQMYPWKRTAFRLTAAALLAIALAPTGFAAAPAAKDTKEKIRNRKDQVAALPEKYRAWLADEVHFLVTKEEERIFLELESDAQRERFIEEFWRRRDDFTKSRGFESRRRHYDRLDEAKRRFETVHDERAKVLVLQGTPSKTTRIRCSSYWPAEVWQYDTLDEFLGGAIVLFYQQYGVGKWRMWVPLDGTQALRNTVSAETASACIDLRELYKAISFANGQGGKLGGSARMAALTEAPQVNDERAGEFLDKVADVPDGAPRFEATAAFSFPSQRGTKIGTELVVRIPRAGLATKDFNGQKYYNLDVVGEIVRGASLLDNFKYKFDFAVSEVDSAATDIALSMQRYLRSGDYEIKLKVHDLNGSRFALLTQALSVPEKPVATAAQAAAGQEMERVFRAAATSLEGPGVIEIIPLSQEIATGTVRIETLVAGTGVERVAFFVDDRRVAVKNRPPFDLDVDLGTLPRLHTVKVVAYAADGSEIDSDTAIVNEGRERFRVRITAPRKTIATGPVDVEADLKLPEEKKLERLEVFWNETLAATLYGPPYRQRVNIPAAAAVGYIKVVAHLESGETEEDLLFMNAPGYVEEMDVNVVELFTSVFDRSDKPVRGLARTDFTVREDGVAQKIANFEYAENLPITLGVAIDTSASMETEIEETQVAAAAFIRQIMTPKDRAFLVDFDHGAYLVQKPTSEPDKLIAKIAGLRADGGTALYDAVIFSLFQFQGVKGKKALVILSDGEDQHSKFDYDKVVDYAKKSGAAIYVIGMKIPLKMIEVRVKLNRLASETGGSVYYVDSARGLASTYSTIEAEMRAQYLLTYYSSNPSRESTWRKVEVGVRKGLTARTMAGYYP